MNAAAAPYGDFLNTGTVTGLFVAMCRAEIAGEPRFVG
jgi:hypothetical protein